MTNLATLADRCEAATGADRGLDAAIHIAVYGDIQYSTCWPFQPSSPPMLSQYVAAYKDVLNSDDAIPDDILPKYTASIDAALTLVPEGMGWTAGWGQTRADEPMGGAVVCRNARFVGYDANYDAIASGEAATPALALTAAALRARATEKPA